MGLVKFYKKILIRIVTGDRQNLNQMRIEILFAVGLGFFISYIKFIY